MIYLIIILILIFSSYFYDFKNQTKNKYLVYNFILVILILVAGLRYRVGLDTIRYMNSYIYMPTISELWTFDYSASRHDPFWIILSSITRTLSPDFTLFQIMHAVFINITIFAFIRKNTPYIFTAALFYFLFIYTNFNFEIMRESLAVSFFLIGSKYLTTKKWYPYLLFSILAFLSHSSAFVVFLFPFFSKIKLNKTVLIILVFSLMFFSFFKSHIFNFTQFLLFTDRLYDKAFIYLDSDYFGGQGLNIKGQILSMVNTCLLPLYALYLSNKLYKNNYPFERHIIFMALITVININILIFYRFLNYVYVFYAVTLANGFFYLNKQFKYKSAKYLFAFYILIISLLQVYTYLGTENDNKTKTYKRYYPYHSVISMKKDSDREMLFHYYRID